MHSFFWQLWTVVPSQTPPMAKWIILLEQHLDRLPPTVVIQATTWWETALAHVKLMECGRGVHLPVRVCCCWSFTVKTLGYFNHILVISGAYLLCTHVINLRNAYNLNESVVDKLLPFVGVGSMMKGLSLTSIWTKMLLALSHDADGQL